MSNLDSSRLFELSALPDIVGDIEGTDKTTISRSGRTGPSTLAKVAAYVKTVLDAYYTWGGTGSTQFPSITGKEGCMLQVTAGPVVQWSGAAGTGAAITQATNRSTGVTINAITGAITMNAASLAAGAIVSFTVTNNQVLATDIPVVAVKSSSTGKPVASVTAVAAGSFEITLRNAHASTADTTADVIAFTLLRGAIA